MMDVEKLHQIIIQIKAPVALQVSKNLSLQLQILTFLRVHIYLKHCAPHKQLLSDQYPHRSNNHNVLRIISYFLQDQQMGLEFQSFRQKLRVL
jgi:hypothetical protein